MLKLKENGELSTKGLPVPDPENSNSHRLGSNKWRLVIKVGT